MEQNQVLKASFVRPAAPKTRKSDDFRELHENEPKKRGGGLGVDTNLEVFVTSSLSVTGSFARSSDILGTIGPLHDLVTWYRINYTGTQVTQWDFQNKGKSGWIGTSSFVLEVPLRNLRPSVIYSLPCDRIVQRAYWVCFKVSWRLLASRCMK